MSYPRCRLCSAELRHTFVDLGMSPPCESYLSAIAARRAETFYPLHVRVCENCLLVQLPAYIPPEDIFSDYAYFSSYSDSWVAHARRFVDEAATRLGLGKRVLRRRGGQQRRLPAAAQRRAGHPLARHRARGKHRRGRSRQGHRHRGHVPRRRDRPRCR